jgi:hypothetical protein
MRIAKEVMKPVGLISGTSALVDNPERGVTAIRPLVVLTAMEKPVGVKITLY